MSNPIEEAEEIQLRKELKFCAKCRGVRTVDETYCGICGTKLSESLPMNDPICDRCGKSVDFINFFCPNCGNPIPSFPEAKPCP